MIVEEMRYNIPRFARTELYFNKFVIMLSPTSVLKILVQSKDTSGANL